MKKQQIQLVILTAALVILIAAFFGIRHYNDLQEQKSDAKDVETIININSDDINSFSYEYDGETYSFKKEDNTWYSIDDPSANLDQTVVNSMVSRLAGIEVVMSIENVIDMSQYGLDKDYTTFEYSTADKTYTLHIGSKNSVTGVYYMSVDSAETVYAIESYTLLGSFERTLDDLIVEDTETEDTAETTEETTEAVETTETTSQQ
jgi:hypothetical protein